MGGAAGEGAGGGWAGGRLGVHSGLPHGAVLLEVKGHYSTAALIHEDMGAGSSLTSLTSLELCACIKVTDQGLRALSILRALTTLNLWQCPNVTAAGAVQALRSAHRWTITLHPFHTYTQSSRA